MNPLQAKSGSFFYQNPNGLFQFKSKLNRNHLHLSFSFEFRSTFSFIFSSNGSLCWEVSTVHKGDIRRANKENSSFITDRSKVLNSFSGNIKTFSMDFLEMIEDEDLCLNYFLEQPFTVPNSLTLSDSWYEELRKKLIVDLKEVIPLPKSQLKGILREKINEEIGSIKENLVRKGEDSSAHRKAAMVLSDEEIEPFIKGEIFGPILLKNAKHLMHFVMSETKKCISTFKWGNLLLFEEAKTSIEKRIREEPKIPKLEEILNNFLDNSSSHPNEEKEEAILDKLNTNTTHLFQLSFLYITEALTKFEVFPVLINEKSRNAIEETLFSLILSSIEAKNKKAFRLFMDWLKRVNQEVISHFRAEEFKREFDSAKSFHFLLINIKKHMEKVKEAFENEEKRFHLKKSELLLKPLRLKVRLNLKTVLSNHVKASLQHYKYSREAISDALKDFFVSFFDKREKPFSKSKFSVYSPNTAGNNAFEVTMKCVPGIMAYSAKAKKLRENHPEILARFKEHVGSGVSSEYINELVSYDNETLKRKLPEWVSEFCLCPYLNREIVLYIIFSVMVIAMDIKLLANGKIKVPFYWANRRHFINKVTRYLKSYDFGYSNWKIVNLIETFLEHFFLSKRRLDNFQLENENFRLQLIRNSSPKEIQHHFLKRKDQIVEYVAESCKIDSSFSTLSPELVHAIFKDESFLHCFPHPELLAMTELKSKPNKFVHLIVPGYSNGVDDQKAFWFPFLKQHSQDEFYAFHWPSFTQKAQILSSPMHAFIEHNKTRADLLTIGLPLLPKILIESMDMSQLCFDPPGGDLFKTAVLMGKILAFLIGKMEMFGGCCINLVGYGLGALISYVCVRELKAMGEGDIVYSMTFVGGVLSVSMLDDEVLSFIPGSVFNCFSKNEKVLRYIVNSVTWAYPCVGIQPIQKPEQKKKVVNLDLSEEIQWHRDYQQHTPGIVDFIDYHEDACFIYSQFGAVI